MNGDNATVKALKDLLGEKRLQALIDPRNTQVVQDFCDRELLFPPTTDSTRLWSEHNGIISLTVTSDGTTGEEWERLLKKKGFRVSPHAKKILLSPGFIPTTGVTYRLAVIKGWLLPDVGRTTENIQKMVQERLCVLPHPEIACLVRLNFSDHEIAAMGLSSLVVMHEPIEGSKFFLSIRRHDRGRLLDAFPYRADEDWRRINGFPFVQTRIQSEGQPS